MSILNLLTRLCPAPVLIFGISLGRPRRIFAQSLGIDFRLLFCLIRVFADLRDALVCRLNVHDKTLLIRRPDDPPIRQSRPTEAACSDGADDQNSKHW